MIYQKPMKLKVIGFNKPMKQYKGYDNGVVATASILNPHNSFILFKMAVQQKS